MDRITTAFLTEFQSAEQLDNLNECEAFERFANFAVMSREFPDTFNIEDVTTGGANDTGLDGIAILVNGTLVHTTEDVEELSARNGYLDATFVFVQSKTSPSFNAAELGSFAFGVQDFFSDSPRLRRNDAVARSASVVSFIYDRSAAMTRRKPHLRMYYVTTGRWTDEPALQARLDIAKSELAATNLFDEIIFNPIDANRLQSLYRDTKSTASAEFKFPHRITLPEMPNVSEAHLGILLATDFVDLVDDGMGNIRKSLFYDNVRDFQDYNEVNQGIQDTLRSNDRDRFVVLNNGITILAKSMHTVGDKFHIEDFQIVNGCQTSHVLFENKRSLTPSVYVPLKVIVTNDENVMAGVITATNRQTTVKPDQLYALSEFQKRLEAYFATFADFKRLYYERRSRQYAAVPSVTKVRIVPIQLQMRAFAAMFLWEAHRGHYPSSLRQLVGSEIFHPSHRLEPYYTSAFAQYRMESFFRNGGLDTQYKPGRYHLLLIARHLASEGAMPSLSANAMEAYCERILAQLSDDARAQRLFSEATGVLDRALAGRELTRDLAKKQAITEDVRRILVS